MLNVQDSGGALSLAGQLKHHDHCSLLKESPLFWRLIDIAKSTGAAASLDELIDCILSEAQSIANADGGTFYLMEGEGTQRQLKFSIVRNHSLDSESANVKRMATQAIPLFLDDDQPNLSHVASFSALKNHVVNIADVYQDSDFDFSGTQQFDLATGYRTRSVLTVPLRDSEKQVIGVLQLLNAQDAKTSEVIEFSMEVQAIVEALSALVALSLSNRLLADLQSSLLVRLSTSESPKQLFQRVLAEAQRITCAEGGTLYIKRTGEQQAYPTLDFVMLFNEPLGLFRGGAGQQPVDMPPVKLFNADGKPNLSNVASYAAHMRQVVTIEDAYAAQEFDFSGTIEFDRTNGYRSQSFLTVPLLNHEDDVIGVLQLLNARNPDTGKLSGFSKQHESIINALAKYASITLNTQNLLQEHKDLLDAFIRCIAKAIDAKSKFTAAHCERVPLLTMLIAEAGIKDQTYLKDFDLNAEELYEVEVAGWLHDCGKLSTPDRVLHKSTKLHLLQDGIEQVTLRVDLLMRERQMALMQHNYQSPWQILIGCYAFKCELDQLQDDKAFLRAANKGSEFMSDAHKARVASLAKLQWTDLDGVQRPLLTEEEVAFLCIERGTLSQAEREIINEHIVVTIDMLESLPFPKNLRRVPEYAGGHHEKMDGTGFPKGLTREQMSIPARMMAIADVFEALTAPDRPYKKTMKISQALSIMKGMRDKNHIDPDIFDMFVSRRVWQTYGERYLKPDQLDVTELSAYLS